MGNIESISKKNGLKNFINFSNVINFNNSNSSKTSIDNIDTKDTIIENKNTIQEVIDIELPKEELNLDIDKDTNELGNVITSKTQSLVISTTSWWNETNEWWNKEAIPTIKNMSNNISNTLKSTGAYLSNSMLESELMRLEQEKETDRITGATVGTISTSLVEGIGKFGESLGDAFYIAGTGLAENQLIENQQLIPDPSLDKTREELWTSTMAYVSKEHVKSSFDDFYENNTTGQYMKDNALGFGTTREIGNGVGYVAGITALTIGTFGVGGAISGAGSVSITAGELAVTAGVSGVGKGTEKAWNEGATKDEGIGYGVLTGLWEGIQYYVGGSIINSLGRESAKEGATKLAIKWGEGLKNKALNVLSRIVMDTADAGLEGFVQPLLTSIYKDGYYDENGEYVAFLDSDSFSHNYKELFNDNGGWSTVWTNATIGAISSSIGEIFDLGRIIKDENIEKRIIDEDITDKLSEIYSDFSTKNAKEIFNILEENDFNNVTSDDIEYIQKYLANRGKNGLDNLTDYDLLVEFAHTIGFEELEASIKGRVFKDNYKGIEISSYGNNILRTKKNMIKAIKAISELPEEIRKATKEIDVYDGHYSNELVAKLKSYRDGKPIKGSILGTSNVDGKIQLWSPAFSTSDETLNTILLHESGHNVDGYLYKYFSNTNETKYFSTEYINWQEAIEADGGLPVSEYGGLSLPEDFAESIKYYFSNETFREKFPNRAKAIDFIIEYLQK